jgi:hypothetical protein
MSMERYLCDTCLYANNCQFIAKHKEGAIGCSAYINTFGVSIDRLREICAAERDGRLVVLPCKVGDTVYSTSPNQDKAIACYVPSLHTIARWIEDGVFGKTVFLTRAEAEEALKGDS